MVHYVSDYRGYRGRREHSVNLALNVLKSDSAYILYHVNKGNVNVSGTYYNVWTLQLYLVHKDKIDVNDAYLSYNGCTLYLVNKDKKDANGTYFT